MRCKERAAHKDYLSASPEEKDSKLADMKKAKKALRNALRKAEKARMRKISKDIEQLKSRDPSEYWRRLYQLNEFEATSKDCLPELVKNSDGQLVGGKEGIEVWQDKL